MEMKSLAFCEINNYKEMYHECNN
ncbi:hypothetical protein PSEUDO8BK_190028 [Pseudomonas sp. 8BK]|nr:hypothetical protein PSEUDO8BK_190028 [Pseudomonas sp. 8BK]